MALVLLIGSVLAACGPATGSSADTGASSTRAGPPTAGPPTPSRSSATPGLSTAGVPTSTSSATPDPAESTAAPLVIDPTLLAILPADAGGVAIEASPETVAEMVADPSLQASASAIAVGAAIVPATFDLAVASVIRLRPGIYSTAFFDRWRTDYDAAACAPAGGVSSHERQVLGTHEVEVTVCAQGARTYHVHLAGDVIVSVTAAGERRLGDLVMKGLRE